MSRHFSVRFPCIIPITGFPRQPELVLVGLSGNNAAPITVPQRAGGSGTLGDLMGIDLGVLWGAPISRTTEREFLAFFALFCYD